MDPECPKEHANLSDSDHSTKVEYTTLRMFQRNRQNKRPEEGCIGTVVFLLTWIANDELVTAAASGFDKVSLDGGHSIAPKTTSANAASPSP